MQIMSEGNAWQSQKRLRAWRDAFETSSSWDELREGVSVQKVQHRLGGRKGDYESWKKTSYQHGKCRSPVPSLTMSATTALLYVGINALQCIRTAHAL